MRFTAILSLCLTVSACGDAVSPVGEGPANEASAHSARAFATACPDGTCYTGYDPLYANAEGCSVSRMERDASGSCVCSNGSSDPLCFYSGEYADTYDPELGAGGYGGSGSGGGGSTSGGSSYPSQCDPRLAGCMLPLRDQEYEALDRALEWLKSDFDTDAARLVCPRLAQLFREALGAGHVMRGNPDIPDGSEPHGGAYYLERIHVDQDVFDATRSTDPYYRTYYEQVLLKIVLHEAAHYGEYQPHPYTETWDAYTTYPYNHGMGTGGVEGCVNAPTT